jgi:hypothetical protein
VFVVGLLIVFLATISLEFPAERFLATCARETLIMNGTFLGLILIKMVHPLGYP